MLSGAHYDAKFFPKILRRIIGLNIEFTYKHGTIVWMFFLGSITSLSCWVTATAVASHSLIAYSHDHIQPKFCPDVPRGNTFSNIVSIFKEVGPHKHLNHQQTLIRHIPEIRSKDRSLSVPGRGSRFLLYSRARVFRFDQTFEEGKMVCLSSMFKYVKFRYVKYVKAPAAYLPTRRRWKHCTRREWREGPHDATGGCDPPVSEILQLPPYLHRWSNVPFWSRVAGTEIDLATWLVGRPAQAIRA